MKRKVYIGLLVLGITSLFTIVVLTGYSIYKDINYHYTLNNIHYEHYTSNESFDVTIKNIRKEKRKEDVYEVDLNNLKGSSTYDLSINLPQSEYDTLIGSGYNTLSSKIYCLELAVPAKWGVYDVYYIDIYRYSCFGEKDFTESEIKDLATTSLEVFNDANTSSADDYDLTSIKEQSKSMQVSLISGGNKKSLKAMQKIVE